MHDEAGESGNRVIRHVSSEIVVVPSADAFNMAEGNTQVFREGVRCLWLGGVRSQPCYTMTPHQLGRACTVRSKCVWGGMPDNDEKEGGKRRTGSQMAR